MHIFITGASGFIGGAIATYLVINGYKVSAMARSASSAEKIRSLGATPVECNLTTIKAEHLATCDIVIHSAAYVEPWGTKDDFWQANVEGTQNMLSAAKVADIKRFIHIGTEAALFRGQHMRNIDESADYAFDSPFFYSSTKAEAESRVLSANTPMDNFATLSLRPRMVWGPGDQTIAPEVKSMVEQGNFVWVNDGQAKTSTTYIDNLVYACELALTKGEGGQAYFITDGEDTDFKYFLTELMSTMNITLPTKSAPGFVVRSLAFIIEGMWRLLALKSTPPLTRLAANLMSRDCTINIDKATKELGYQPKVSLVDGMKTLTKLNQT